MSNHAAKPRPKPQHRFPKLALYWGLPVLAIATLIVGPQIHRRWFQPDYSWPAFSARVLETRLSRTGLFDGTYGGRVYYRIDVHATWIDNGVQQQAWVPTTKTSTDPDWLKLWLWQHPKISCAVHRNPRNAADMFAEINVE
jgi:hypothetical protein